MSEKQSPTLKGAETRRKNIEARNKRRAEEREENELIKTAMLSILKDPNASSAQKLEAARYIKGGRKYGG